MEVVKIDGLDIAYDVVGEGTPWVTTPGGRFTMDSPGVRTLAEDLAKGGMKVLLWDRPNVGASSVCFDGSSESAMQADAAVARRLAVDPLGVVGAPLRAPARSVDGPRRPEGGRRR